MKLLDAKEGQHMLRRLPSQYGLVGEVWFEDGEMKWTVGPPERDWFEWDDWEPVETDAEKIARLEAELAAAREEVKRVAIRSVEQLRQQQYEQAMRCSVLGCTKTVAFGDYLRCELHRAGVLFQGKETE